VSREAKKAPGDAKLQREKHLKRQAAQDAISALKRGETVTVQASHEGCPVTVTVTPIPEEGAWGVHVLCLVGRRLQVMSDETRRGGTSWIASEA